MFGEFSPYIAMFVRWSARILSVLILLFWGFFLVASVFGDAAQPTRPLLWSDYVGLGSLLIALAGLAMAWRWELAGGFVTICAIMICTAVNWRVLLFPGTMIPITAVLFILAWCLSQEHLDHQVLS